MRPLPHWHTAPTAWFIPPVTAADTPVAIPLGVLQPAADTRRTAEEVEALRAAVAVRIPPVEVAATAAEVPLVAARVVEEAVVEEKALMVRKARIGAMIIVFNPSEVGTQHPAPL